MKKIAAALVGLLAMPAAAQAAVTRMCEQLLANTVIENFHVELG